MAAYANIDGKMASMMNLVQEWRDKEDEDSREDLSDELEEELKSLPVGLSEVHERFFESLKEEVAQGGPLEAVPQVVERGRQRLPVRNQCTDIPEHVTCFKEHNGLIHGGIITAPTYTLTCRAFRLEYIRRMSILGVLNFEHIEAVVAGVCEQRNQSNKIINPPWSTASEMPLTLISKGYYSSASSSLPTPAMRKIIHGKKGRGWFGYYIPKGWTFKHTIDTPDTGQPTYARWIGGKYLWDYHPLKSGIENAFYNKQEKCSEGFVICTPYIKIFHPDPNMKETVVSMIGAYRNQARLGNINSSEERLYNRSAQWYCKTFR